MQLVHTQLSNKLDIYMHAPYRKAYVLNQVLC